MKEIKLKNLADTKNLAKEIIDKFKHGGTIGLVGDLGVGKTTFVQFIAQELVIKEAVKSPTFVLMKEYKVKSQSAKVKSLVHVDAYRLESGRELLEIGLGEFLNQKNTLVVIEWADKVKEILPKDILLIEFKEGQAEEERIVMID